MATEKRLIDANELLEKHTCDVYGAYDDSCMLKAVFVPYIKGAPTVDAVEVVRCEHCAHSLSDGWICGGPSFTMPSHPTYPDAFCSYGERKDNG